MGKQTFGQSTYSCTVRSRSSFFAFHLHRRPFDFLSFHVSASELVVRWTSAVVIPTTSRDPWPEQEQAREESRALGGDEWRWSKDVRSRENAARSRSKVAA